MTDEQVEPTYEWRVNFRAEERDNPVTDAWLAVASREEMAAMIPEYAAEINRLTDKCNQARAEQPSSDLCPDCGQSLKGAGDK